MDEIFIKLEQMKKIYRSEKLPNESADKGWNNIKFRLPQQNVYYKNNIFAGRFFPFGASLLILFFAVIGFSQTAKPGDAFYPVRVLGDRAFSTFVGNPESKPKQNIVTIEPVKVMPSPTIKPDNKEKSLSKEAEEASSSAKSRGGPIRRILEQIQERFSFNNHNKKEKDIKSDEKVKGIENNRNSDTNKTEEAHPSGTNREEEGKDSRE